MMFPKPIILIIHQTRLAASYASTLEKTGAEVHAVTSFQEANELLSFLHPDIIILASKLNNLDGREYCQEIRATIAHPRPVLVLLDSSNDIQDRINSFRYGADDVLGEPIDVSELAIRIMAHLRRRNEEMLNPLTGMPGPQVIRRMIEQTINSEKPHAYMSIDLNRLRIYNDTYGDLAGDQLIKALAAILLDVVSGTNFVGHLEEDDFFLISSVDQAEKIAKNICNNFDKISQSFYPKEDLARGYLIALGHAGIRRRVPLISVAIGIVNNYNKRYSSYVDVLTSTRDYRYLAKTKIVSHYMSQPVEEELLNTDKINNTAANNEAQVEPAKNILVVEPDGAMACLLQESLSLEGFSVQVTNAAYDALKLAKGSPQPDLILLESNLKDRFMNGWELCRSLKEDPKLKSIWIVVVTSNPDQTAALEAGADLYLPKPFDLPSLLHEINALLNKGYSIHHFI